MRISDWSSDVCSSDLRGRQRRQPVAIDGLVHRRAEVRRRRIAGVARRLRLREAKGNAGHSAMLGRPARPVFDGGQIDRFPSPARSEGIYRASSFTMRSEEHTSELQSLMRISYAVFCLKKKKK